MEADEPGNATLARRAWVALCAVVALHLGLLSYFAPWRVMLSTEPVVVVDYSLHAYQVERARVAFRSWGGHLWAWDPYMRASLKI